MAAGGEAGVVANVGANESTSRIAPRRRQNPTTLTKNNRRCWSNAALGLFIVIRNALKMAVELAGPPAVRT